MDLQFLIIKSDFKKIPPLLEFSNPNDSPYVYMSCVDSIKSQVLHLGLNTDINIIEYKDIPSKVNAHLVVFLSEKSLVPSDYVNRILAMNNLHTNAGAFCGPIFTQKPEGFDWFTSKIAETYMRYSLDSFSSFISCSLTKDNENYPPIFGNVFVGHYYNKIGGYNPIKSERANIYTNPKCFERLERSGGELIYSERLSSGYYITAEEMSIENFKNYYYSMGYAQGVKSTAESFTHQYIQNSNMLEIENITWVTENRNVDNNLEYKKNVSILKCMYDLGYFEGMTGKLLV